MKDTDSRIQKYEYKTLLLTVEIAVLQETLSLHGREGWRLVQAMSSNVPGNAILIFERPS